MTGFFLVCEKFKYLKISILTKIVQMPIKQPLRVVLDTPWLLLLWQYLIILKVLHNIAILTHCETVRVIKSTCLSLCRAMGLLIMNHWSQVQIKKGLLSIWTAIKFLKSWFYKFKLLIVKLTHQSFFFNRWCLF